MCTCTIILWTCCSFAHLEQLMNALAVTSKRHAHGLRPRFRCYLTNPPSIWLWSGLPVSFPSISVDFQILTKRTHQGILSCTRLTETLVPMPGTGYPDAAGAARRDAAALLLLVRAFLQGHIKMLVKMTAVGLNGINFYRSKRTVQKHLNHQSFVPTVFHT